MEVTNRQYKDLTYFIRICQVAGVEPTKRQASKFRRKTGTAYREGSRYISLLPTMVEAAKMDLSTHKRRETGLHSAINNLIEEGVEDDHPSMVRTEKDLEHEKDQVTHFRAVLTRLEQDVLLFLNGEGS